MATLSTSGTDEITVRGGAGGVTASYDDMLRAGGLLVTLSGSTGQHALTLAAMAISPEVLGSAFLAPGQAAGLEVKIARAGTALTATALAAGAEGLFLVGAVEAYRLADEALAVIKDAAESALAFGIGLVAIPVVLTAGALEVAVLLQPNLHPVSRILLAQQLLQADKQLLGDAFNWLQEHPAVLEFLTAHADDLISGLTTFLSGGVLHTPPLSFENTLRAVLAGAGIFGYLLDGHLRLVDGKLPQAPPPKTPITLPTSLATAFVGLGDLDKNDGRNTGSKDDDYARVRIVTSVGADGVTRYIVEIPSTANWDKKAGAQPNDLTACLGEMANQDTVLTEGVKQAMRQAGIPDGAPVVFTGFSLGGITAAKLASDPSINQKYDVQAVLTGGSPIARFDIPPTTQVLSIEHANDAAGEYPDDPVPHLDGGPNPDLPNWTTVTATSPVVPAPDKTGGVDSSPHDADTYGSTAGDPRVTNDPSVQRYLQTVDPFFNGQQTAQDYQVQREP